MPTRDIDRKALIATLDVDIARIQAEDAWDRDRYARRGWLEDDQHAKARVRSADDQRRRVDLDLDRYTANMTSIARQDKAGVDELIARADRQLAAARSARLPRQGRTAYVECPRCDTVVDVNGHCACHCYAD